MEVGRRDKRGAIDGSADNGKTLGPRPRPARADFGNGGLAERQAPGTGYARAEFEYARQAFGECPMRSRAHLAPDCPKDFPAALTCPHGTRVQ